MVDGDKTEIIRKSWEMLAAGELDNLATNYTHDMIFVLPGHDDVLKGRDAFRSALDNIGQALPPGFDIKSLSYCAGDNEVVNIIHFTAEKLPNVTQCAVLFRFNNDNKIIEERWFVDTEKWKAAF